MKYTTVIFDLDGTLLNTLEDLMDAVNYALHEYGYPKRTLDEIRTFVGNGAGILVKRALPDGESNPDFEEILSVFTTITARCRRRFRPKILMAVMSR